MSAKTSGLDSLLDMFSYFSLRRFLNPMEGWRDLDLNIGDMY
jgi:hypothetical protein